MWKEKRYDVGEKMTNDKIIAVDFDGTLCVNNWPYIGEPNLEIINYIKDEREKGTKIILWTCRSGDLLIKAIRWCNKQGLTFDHINENTPELVDAFGSDTRKIFADEYIDDRMSDKFKLPFIARHSHYGKMGGITTNAINVEERHDRYDGILKEDEEGEKQ